MASSTTSTTNNHDVKQNDGDLTIISACEDKREYIGEENCVKKEGLEEDKVIF